MTTVLPFSNNTINVELYQPFSYTIPNPYPTTPFTSVVASSLVNPFVTNNISNVVFASATGYNASVASNNALILTATDPSSGQVSVSSNTINYIRASFKDSNGATLNGQSFTFFKNEPITPVRFNSPIAVSSPVSFPTLPVGLSFVQVDASSYELVGTPLAQLPSSNYFITASAIPATTGRSVSSTVSMIVNAERIQITTTPSNIISGMQLDTPIVPRVITSSYPLQSSGNLRYSWSPLPIGFFLTDYLGNLVTGSSFVPVDPSATLVLQGVPTEVTARSFSNAGQLLTFTATRLSPSGLSNNEVMNLSFAEAILYVYPPVVPKLFVDAPANVASNAFFPLTYFKTGPNTGGITQFFSTDLPLDLSTSYTFPYGTIVGTPLAPAFPGGSYTFRAINNNGVVRDIQVPIQIDFISVAYDYSVTPAIDTCYNFILSRSLANPKAGYYTSPIQFRATASSGSNITFSAPGLNGTGLSLSNVGNNTVQLVGVPEVVQGLTSLTVTATVAGTGQTGDTTIKYAILGDVFTFASVPTSNLTYVQNRPITPFQITATTLSERLITSYVGSNLPVGLSISTTGLVSGTPTGFTVSPQVFTVTASTGYASGSANFTYTIQQDNILIVTTETPYVTTGPSFSAEVFDALAYSGANATFNTTLTDIRPRFGMPGPELSLSLTSNGVLSGDFSLPDPLFPEYAFTINANAASAAQTNYASLVVGNCPIPHHVAFTRSAVQGFTISNNDAYPYTVAAQYSTSSPYTPQIVSPVFSNGWSSTLDTTAVDVSLSLTRDIAKSPTSLVALYNETLYRSTNGRTWELPTVTFDASLSTLKGPFVGTPPGSGPQYYPSPIFRAVSSDGGSNWFAVGHGTVPDYSNPCNASNYTLYARSSNDGASWSVTSDYVPWASLITGPSPNTGSSAVGLYTRELHTFCNRYYAVFNNDIQSNQPFGQPIGYKSSASSIAWTTMFTDVSLNAVTSIAGDGLGNLLIVGDSGSNDGLNAFLSTDSGSNWIFRFASTVQGIRDAKYAYGTWMVAEDTGGASGRISYTSNVSQGAGPSSWSNVDVDTTFPDFVISNQYITRIDNDGSAWLFYGETGVTANQFVGTVNGSTPLFAGGDAAVTRFSNNLARRPNKVFTFKESQGTPYGIVTLPTYTGGLTLSFIAPSNTYYPLYQYIPMSTITTEVSVDLTQNTPVFFYGRNLPRGLTFSHTDPNLLTAEITGRPSQFLGGPQTTTIFARRPLTIGTPEGVTARLDLQFDVLIPRIIRKQDGAGAYTNLLRQYVETNAAQNAIGSRVLNTQERRLGEFMAPPNPPDIVLTPIDQRCFSTSNCL
jgi:hypothetical protein